MISAIDLSDKIGGSIYFSWREALWLHSWDICAVPETPEIVANIVKTAGKMDLIRDIFGKPIYVTSWLRPIKYNKKINGSKASRHIRGMACDFVVGGISSDEIRAGLKPLLSDLNIRVEHLDGASWVHMDTDCDENTPDERRYFRP